MLGFEHSSVCVCLGVIPDDHVHQWWRRGQLVLFRILGCRRDRLHRETGTSAGRGVSLTDYSEQFAHNSCLSWCLRLNLMQFEVQDEAPPNVVNATFNATSKPIYAMTCVQRKQEALRTLMNFRASEVTVLSLSIFTVDSHISLIPIILLNPSNLISHIHTTLACLSMYYRYMQYARGKVKVMC